MNKPNIGVSMNFMKLGQYEQFHIRDKYIDAVYDNGGLPMPVPCFTDKDTIRAYLKQLKGLIIIGGMDYPPAMYGQAPHPKADIMTARRAESDLLLFQVSLELRLPLLGICAGMQLMNIATGGKLIQHLDNVDYHYGEKYHSIRFANSRWLTPIFHSESIVVNSNHHQGIDTAYVGKGFTPVAFTEDGQIEAIEYECGHMVLGIQWHPERITQAADYATAFTSDQAAYELIGKHRNLFFTHLINNLFL